MNPSEEANSPVVIIGSGLAGYTVAKELRRLDREVTIDIITQDDGAYYSKPALSNAFATRKTPEQLPLRSFTQMEQELNVRVFHHTAVSSIHTHTQQIVTSRGSSTYSSLVMAVGSESIRIPNTSSESRLTWTVNDLNDYGNFRRAISGKKRIVIIGAGLVGCEFANDLALAGYEVDVVDRGAWPLERFVRQEMGHLLMQALSKLGINWHFGCEMAGLTASQNGHVLTLSDGTILQADAVLEAIGVRPRTQLARESGLAVSKGIVVNASLQTSARNVYAVGDCAEVDGEWQPFIAPLMQAARVAALNIMGQATPLRNAPAVVTVKTPSCPIMVAQSQFSRSGEWRFTPTRDGGVAELLEGNILRGFALIGDTMGDKAKWMARLNTEVVVGGDLTAQVEQHVLAHQLHTART